MARIPDASIDDRASLQPRCDRPGRAAARAVSASRIAGDVGLGGGR